MGLKIALFGLTLSSSWGNGHATPYRALIRALARRNHRIVFFEKDVDYYALRRDFDRWEYCDLVLYRDWNEVRERALASAADSDVAVVASYCPQGARIADEVLKLTAPLRVYYDLDTPITLERLRAGDLEYLRADQIPDFNLYLSFTGGRILAELESDWGAQMARPLYGCVDPDQYRRAPENERFRCSLSYMGTFAADRQAKLDELFLVPARRMPESQFVLAGSLYPWQWSWPSNVRRFDHVPPAEHPSLYSSSRATLNITRAGMACWGYCPSGRFFEAAACGCAMLSDNWEGLESFFRNGEEMLLVKGSEDVISALNRSDEELARMGNRARERTLDEHTGERRAQQLLRYLEEAAMHKKAVGAEPQPVRTAQEVGS
ncbi:MAG TPA: glycosyltransferase [Terriglobales bacterium]|jgi:spore maturation protein CgeB|nr:glycosyltransferase [Terriglobales bacterium]